MKTPLTQAIALALGTAALSCGGVLTAWAGATTMYNLTTAAGKDNSANTTNPTGGAGPFVVGNGPWALWGGGTDGWTNGLMGVSTGTGVNTGGAKWAGTTGTYATPFGYTGAHLNWGLSMDGPGSAEISTFDSFGRYGVYADIDTAKGAWSDNNPLNAGAFGWRHDLDFGLFRADVSGMVTLKATGIIQTGTNFGFTIFKGMDTVTNYGHHGPWNSGNNSAGLTNQSVPWVNGGALAGQPLSVNDIVAYSIGGSAPRNLNNICFPVQAGQVYSVFIGGYRNGSWGETVDGYRLTAELVAGGFCSDGALANDADKKLFSFTSDGITPVTIKTMSYASGGFDPRLSLFDQWGVFVANVQPNGYLNDDADNGGPCVLAQPDPTTGKCYDALYTGVLPAGKYWLALTESNNSVATNRIEAFSWDGHPNQSAEFGCSNKQFCDADGNNRTNNWSLQITGSQNAKLEPAFVAPTSTVPQFVGGTTTVNVVQGGRLDLGPNLHIKDPDAGQTIVYSLVTPPAHGSVTIAGNAMVQTPGNDLAPPPDTLVYSPTPGYLGPDTLTIRASDSSCPPTPPPPPGGAATPAACVDYVDRTFTVGVNALPGFVGTPFSADDGQRFFSFATDGTKQVTLKTSSYAAGGLDPLLTLFDAYGNFVASVQPGGFLNDDADDGGPCVLAQPDPTTGKCLDALYQGVLPAGKYWVVLSESNNLVNGDRIERFAWDGSPNASAGFGCSNKQFCDAYGNNRSPIWNLEILMDGVPAGEEQPDFVPAPSTAPVFVGGTTSFTIARNTILDLVPNAHVSDPDLGQTIAYSLAAAPAHGTVTIAGAATVQTPGTDLAPPAGSLSYTPAPDFIGTDTFTLSASDGSCAVPPPPEPGSTPPAPTCQDSNNRTYTVTILNHLPPVANAGANQITVSTSLVTLDGSGSYDPEGLPITYKWTQTAGPTVALSDPIEVKPSFIAPSVAAPTNLSFNLVVTDTDPSEPKTSSAASVSVQVLPVGSQFPVAVPSVVDSGQPTVVLDGSASTGAGQPVVKYEWTQYRIGSEPSVVLTPNPTNPALASFPAPNIDGVLTFQLRVSTNPNANPAVASDWSAPAFVSVTLNRANLPPEAEATAVGGPAARAGTVKTLDASGSSDPQGTPLTYQWTEPAGYAGILSSTTAVMPTFTAPMKAAGQSLTFGLTVSDGVNTSPPTSVSVLITDQNQAPVVQILAPPVTEGNEVVVNSQVSDPDGDSYTLLWQQISGPAITPVGGLNQPSLRFTAPAAGSAAGPLVLQLTATDGFPPNPLSTTATASLPIANNPAMLNCVRAVAGKNTLWRPNGSMQQVRIVNVQAPAELGITINSVYSDEPVKNRKGKDTTGPDARIKKGNFGGAPQDSVLLRAERSTRQPGTNAPGNGRVYQVNYTATSAGQTCTGSVKVQVPMRRGVNAVDDGAQYDATKRK